MFKLFKSKIRNSIISNASKVIFSAAGDLSVYGYPDEAAEIRKALERIDIKERANKELGVQQPSPNFRYTALDSSGREIEGEFRGGQGKGVPFFQGELPAGERCQGAVERDPRLG